MSEEDSNCWEMKAKFDKLTYWNHDTYPSKDDDFLRSFHWFAVAEAVSPFYSLVFFFINICRINRVIRLGVEWILCVCITCVKR